MKKVLAIFALLLGAATGAYSGEWNGAGSTSGGISNGSDFNGDDIVAKTLSSTGTAPSLTATGGAFTSSITVVSPGDAGQIGALTVVNNSGSLGQQIKFRHVVASSLKTFGYDNNYGAFLFSDNDAGDSTTATSMLQVTRLGLMRISDAASYLSYPVPGARLHVTSTGTTKGILVDGAATNPFTIGTSTLVVNGGTGNVGIGTAAPGAPFTVFRSGPSAGRIANFSSDNGNASGIAITQNAQGTWDLYLPAATNRFAISADGKTTELLSITSGGNLGIGTASPASKLDVAGDAQFGSGVNKATVTAGGFWQPLSQTTLQASLLAPTSLGQYIQNSTTNELCKSTGTSAGNWQKVDGGGGCF